MWGEHRCLVQSLELEAARGGIQAVSKHRAIKREIAFIDLENRESTNKIYKLGIVDFLEQELINLIALDQPLYSVSTSVLHF